MAQPFNCTHCGTLRPSNAHFCKKCGQPFRARRVSPLAPSGARTRQIVAPPIPSAAPTGGPRNKPGASRIPLQKISLSIIWAVVTLTLLWLTFHPNTPAEAETGPTVDGPSTAASEPSAMPPDVEKVYHTDVKGKDGALLGEFDIVLLTKQHVWFTGSTRLVKGLGDITGKGKTPFSPRLNQRILDAPEVIVIGTADAVPTAVRNNPREVRRADDRSTTLYQVVSKMKDEQAVFKTNFGQWAGGTDEQISYDDQRRIIIVEVRHRSKNLPLNEGLRQALEQYQSTQRIFYHLLNNYSKSKSFEVL